MSHHPDTGARLAGITDVVVIGAGHAGLAASYHLSRKQVPHVLLERGEVANAWRERNWDSLHLLTPNWQTQLPGYQYDGDDPDGFMDTAALIQLLEQYARNMDAPVHTQTEVTSVSKFRRGYKIQTNRGEWHAKAVIIASGASSTPTVPAVAKQMPDTVTQLTPLDYRSPEHLDAGGVLIVGASATGMQFADEISRAGFEVTIAVGEHVRMPRHYRGRDILFWMDRCGILAEDYEQVDDLQRARRLPSAQLVGSYDKPILDLNSLRAQGVRIAGRLMGVNGDQAQFSGSLRNVCALADLKMQRLLRSIDSFIGADPTVPAAANFAATEVDTNPLLLQKLGGDAIKTVIWATGFKPDYSWLDVPVTDHKGQLQHDGGVVTEPGLYVLGLPMMRTRRSSFIAGARDDAYILTEHLHTYLQTKTRARSDTNVVYRDHTGATGFRRSA